MADYAVSPEADNDLDRIFDIGVGQFGLQQAARYQEQLHRQFQLLADFPGIGGKPLPIAGGQLYRSPFASHVIIYRITETGIVIVRVVHGHMDYLRQL